MGDEIAYAFRTSQRSDPRPISSAQIGRVRTRMTFTGTEIRSYEDLRVWQCGVNLADSVFRLTRALPRDGWGLAAQMRRAAVSVPSNIAEGWGRGSRRDFLR